MLELFGFQLLCRAFCQAPDLERLGCPDEGLEHVLRHVGLTFVHVLDQGLEVVEVDVLHEDDRMLVVQIRRSKESLEKKRVEIIE